MVGPCDVAVLGAGPAGLAAAWELAARGASVVVLEAGASVGGMAGTVQRDGWRFDYGGHRFLTRWPELLERVEKLLGDELLTVDRHSVVLNDGRRIGYPLELFDLLRQLPLRRGLRYASSYLWERTRRPQRDQRTFEGWMTSRFGPALYAEFFAPYTRKLWGIDPARLSAEWAPQRIGSFDLGVALRSLVRPARQGPRTYARRFLYPRLGMGQLFEAIAAEVERLGGRILLRSAVTGLALEGTSVRAARTASFDLEASYFVSTVPLPALASFLGLETPLRFRGLRFLNLMLDAPAHLGSTWAYLSDGEAVVSRVQEPARRSPFMIPPGCGSLQLEIPASPGEPVWSLDDEALLAAALDDLRRARVATGGALLGVFSTRLPFAYPIHDVEARARIERCVRAAGALENLELCGRQGRFSYVFSDRAMEDGIAVARRWLGLPETLPVEREEDRCLTETTSLIG